MQTEPPPRATFSGTVNQWVIFDAYTTYEKEKELQEEEERMKGIKKDSKVSIKKLLGDKPPPCEVKKTGDTLLKSARILERMVNQNTYNEIALGKSKHNNSQFMQNDILQFNRGFKSNCVKFEIILCHSDFRYWEDASDEFRDTEGTLLPLWKFSFDKAKNLEITGLCWNPGYTDLFAASFGSCKCIMLGIKHQDDVWI